MSDSTRSREPAKSVDVSGKGDRLVTSGFVSLLSVSFLEAANDNLLKQILMLMVVTGGLWANQLGDGTQGIISLVLSVPFIFLSGYAGLIADKYSKQRVIFWVKVAEVPIAICALIGLLLGSFWLSVVALLCLGIHSTFLGPAKYGVIPDLVGNHRLSQANGFINALTNVAVILGSLAAGPLADLYYPTTKQAVVATSALDVADGENATVVAASTTTPHDDYVLVPDPSRQPQRLPIGITLVLVSVLGLVAITAMPKMQPVDPNLTLSFDFLRGHMQTLKDASRPVMVVLMSWSGFYFIGALALLLIPEYRSVLGVSNSSITSLVGALAISIVIGSCAVGWLSGRSIRPYYALLGAAGMTFSFAIMGIAPMTYERLAILISLVGISAGFYIVPLQSLLQYLSPPAERGRFFGTANALSFVFIAASGVLFFALRQAGVPTERMPLVCAGLAFLGTIVGMLELKQIMRTNKNVSIT